MLNTVDKNVLLEVPEHLLNVGEYVDPTDTEREVFAKTYFDKEGKINIMNDKQ